MKADRFRNYNPLGSSFQMDDSKFINEFVSTLPQSGSNSMLDQILEIDYPDYVVDVDNLHLRMNSAITLMKLDGQKPYEVPNTPNHQCGSTVVTVK